LNADAGKIHRPSIHVLVEPRYVGVLVVSVASEYDASAESRGHIFVLEQFQFHALIEQNGDQRGEPVAGIPREHIGLEIKVQVRGE
jgi:hypothetical protein